MVTVDGGRRVSREVHARFLASRAVRFRPATRLREGASVREKYAFIDAEYATCAAPCPTVTQMCSWLDVSRSGFYDWRSRAESAAERRRQELKLLITKAFEDSDGTYGYRRIAAQLTRWGVAAGVELVRALMRELGLVACQPRPLPPSTTQQGAPRPTPQLANPEFTAAPPGAQIVGELTYVPN